ncbi:MAG TPA: XisI protein [Blastocatellia bacterium]|nr:XisI protein [Blastocatellia bacterium]
MDKLTEYRNLIKRILTEHVELSKSQFKAGVEPILITDEERGHYMWLKLGWENGRRVKYITVYARLRDGKFWIEEDLTEDGIATDLVREGVPKEDIVLAFHDPETRKHTDFAAA